MPGVGKREARPCTSLRACTRSRDLRCDADLCTVVVGPPCGDHVEAALDGILVGTVRLPHQVALLDLPQADLFDKLDLRCLGAQRLDTLKPDTVVAEKLLLHGRIVTDTNEREAVAQCAVLLLPHEATVAAPASRACCCARWPPARKTPAKARP